jgi:hypothetical protein
MFSLIATPLCVKEVMENPQSVTINPSDGLSEWCLAAKRQIPRVVSWTTGGTGSCSLGNNLLAVGSAICYLLDERRMAEPSDTWVIPVRAINLLEYRLDDLLEDCRDEHIVPHKFWIDFTILVKDARSLAHHQMEREWARRRYQSTVLDQKVEEDQMVEERKQSEGLMRSPNPPGEPSEGVMRSPLPPGGPSE